MRRRAINIGLWAHALPGGGMA